MPTDPGNDRRVRLTVAQVDAASSGEARRRRIARLLSQEWAALKGRIPLPVRKAARAATRIVSSVALALSLSAIIDGTGILDGLDGVFQREVARKRSAAEPALPGQHALEIRHIEIGAAARVAYLEQRDEVTTADIERVGGVAPIDRHRMAELLSDLAERLEARAGSPGAPPRWVVAVDVDLAPLNERAADPGRVGAMHAAIKRLREHADVVAITLPRPTVEGRRARNAFMAASLCTLSKPASRDDSLPPPRHGLYFASPRIFHAVGAFPINFPAQTKKASTRDLGDLARTSVGALPSHFPALGTAIYLLHRDPQGLESRRTLTALCDQASARPDGSDGRLLEDHLPPDGDLDAYKWYATKRFNWRLLESAQLRSTVVERLVPADAAAPVAAVPLRLLDLDPQNFDSPVLLLGIDGGSRHDKFEVAGTVPGSASGASLHALQALSMETPVSECDTSRCGLLADILLGAAFALIWMLLHPMLEKLRRLMPIVGGWLIAATPILIAFVLMWAIVEVAAVGMGIDLWLNPAYLMLGLLLEAYMEGWRRAHRVSPEEQEERDRHFGISSAWGALQRGYGRRLDIVEVSVTTGQARLEATAVSAAPGYSGATLADRVLSAVLRVTVLVVGLTLLVIKLNKGA